jgi:hypothetical protein
MKAEDVFTTSQSWFTAHGNEGGKPSMFRGRQILEAFVGDRSLPTLLVITIPFDATDLTGLPTEEQYKLIGEFERQCIDEIECKRLGLVAFIKTCNGLVRYFLYVRNAESAGSVLPQDIDATPASLNWELAAADDPDWHEYRAFLQGMKPG